VYKKSYNKNTLEILVKVVYSKTKEPGIMGMKTLRIMLKIRLLEAILMMNSKSIPENFLMNLERDCISP
jgi:hypothetical protein